MIGAKFVAGLLPSSNLEPPGTALWFPLDTGTGVATNDTTNSGFQASTDLLMAGTAALRVNPGSVQWQTDGGGGIKFLSTTASAAFAYDPTGNDRTRLARLVDFANFEVGERIYVGFDVYTPAGFDTAQGTSALSILGIGDFATASASGYLQFGLSSGLYGQVAFRSPGATAGGSLTANTGVTAARDGYWNVHVLELECTAANTFKLRQCHAFGATVETSSWTAAVDLSKSDASGTAPPGLATDNGVRIGATRNGSTGNQNNCRWDMILRNVWAVRYSGGFVDSALAAMARDMISRPGQFPLTMRRLGLLNPDLFLEPVGSGMNGGVTFAPITQADMFIGFDGNRPIPSGTRNTWFATVFVEPTTEFTQNSVRTSRLAADNSVAPPYAGVPGWYTDANGEYLPRLDTVEGGYKFARFNSPPVGGGRGAFLMSSWKNDVSSLVPTSISYNGRQEIVTFGPSCDLPRRRSVWIAGRYYCNWTTLPNGEYVIVFQIKPDPSMSPPLAISFYGNRVDVIRRHSLADYLPSSYGKTEDVDKFSTKGVAVAADWKGKWFDLCINMNFDPEALGGGFCKIYFDNTLVYDYTGPIGYGGISREPAKPNYIQNVRWSNYPNSSSEAGWTGGRRDVWISRCFVCTDVEGYTLSQVRSALVA